MKRKCERCCGVALMGRDGHFYCPPCFAMIVKNEKEYPFASNRVSTVPVADWVLRRRKRILRRRAKRDE